MIGGAVFAHKSDRRKRNMNYIGWVDHVIVSSLWIKNNQNRYKLLIRLWFCLGKTKTITSLFTTVLLNCLQFFVFFFVNCLLNFVTNVNILGTNVINAATKLICSNPCRYTWHAEKMSNKWYTYWRSFFLLSNAPLMTHFYNSSDTLSGTWHKYWEIVSWLHTISVYSLSMFWISIENGLFHCFEKLVSQFDRLEILYRYVYYYPTLFRYRPISHLF